MLSVTGLNKFYFLKDFHDMRCKYGNRRKIKASCGIYEPKQHFKGGFGSDESRAFFLFGLKTKFEEEHKQNLSLQARMDKLLETIGSLREQLDLMNRHTYGSKTQKRKPGKSKAASVDHTKDKDDFDGTPGSIGMDSTSASASNPVSKAWRKQTRKLAIIVKEWNIALWKRTRPYVIVVT